MDSLTQIALGSAVAYAAGGKVLGRRAVVWGAVLGTLPDLDSFYPFADAVNAFTWHRGYSHSLLILSALSPFLALLIARIHGLSGTHWRRCLLMVWLCLITHPLLDAFTIYGTQLLLPLSDHPFGLGSIFIIDPIYTLPLLAGVAAVSLGGGDRCLRARINLLGLALSTSYLLAATLTQYSFSQDLDRLMSESDIRARETLVQPTPFNTVLWRVLVRVDDGYYEGYRSVLDASPVTSLDFYDSQDSLAPALLEHNAGKRLAWFSKGQYRILADSDALVFSDLRMGLEPFYVFNFRLSYGADGREQVEQLSTGRDLPGAFGLLARRAIDPGVKLNADAFATLAAGSDCAAGASAVLC